MLPSLPVRVIWTALLAVTVSVDEWPLLMVEGSALIATVAVGEEVTVMVALAEVVPPGPVAVAV